MVNRIHAHAPGKHGQEQEPSNSPSTLLSSHRTRTPDQPDELIVSLADRYENQRARQVGEWEKLYGQNVYREL